MLQDDKLITTILLIEKEKWTIERIASFIKNNVKVS